MSPRRLITYRFSWNQFACSRGLRLHVLVTYVCRFSWPLQVLVTSICSWRPSAGSRDLNLLVTSICKFSWHPCACSRDLHLQVLVNSMSHDHSLICEETFLSDFVAILKQPLQNGYKILKKCLLVTSWIFKTFWSNCFRNSRTSWRMFPWYYIYNYLYR